MLKLSEASNKNKSPEDGESLFLLDALLTKISSLAQSSEDSSEEVKAMIERMMKICIENDAAEGTQLCHSGQMMYAITLINKNKVKEATEVLEKTYEIQLKQLKNEKRHPFLESTQAHLGMMYKGTYRFKEAQQMYQDVVESKTIFYGENSETLLVPLKNLAQCQFVNREGSNCLSTFERALSIANDAITNETAKDVKNVQNIRIELLTLY